ncbi:nucleoside 2-deoxyribosyltransferase [filamentous cyanobacterium LEGE 11480]|uniref:Nucleoside 2-deoxyribosyltransferase n=1 Tax=Romeriopsis navalis LEGE 11480 TaxID=2777977 RepID=A0A928VVQ4_9CYAN|nr:nucleoside 2-deoxyribosyltransferase [Romeriopsis navalis]MBE9033089.1 nucleoside 2-deoxyribosyltransferase [Romeriopsis navalis LEGE 11480]
MSDHSNRADYSTSKTLYLANPYGFSSQQRELLLPPIIDQLTAIGATVWEPFERNNQVDFAVAGWAHQVAQADVKDVENADGIFAVVNGTPPDEGVMVELGIAIALKKPVFLFRDDFRKCSDSEEYPLNLMLFASLPANGWQQYFYTSVNEIADADKALAKWLKS